MKRTAKGRSVSFVFPVYNEAENLETTLARAIALAGRIAEDYEIVVADDASTDGSAAIVERLAGSDRHIKPVRLTRNTRFGGALAAGIAAASKDVIIYTDADFPAREEDIVKALDLVGAADVVTAYSLVIKDASLKRIVMSRTYNFLVRLLFGLRLRDINSGLKIYTRRAVEGLRLRSTSPFVDVEIFVEARRRGCAIAQYGLIFDLRTRGSSTIARPGVVARTFWDMLVYRFGGGR